MHRKTRELFIPGSGRKVIQLVLDGLGGLPDPGTGRTELETANIPNLDRLASCSSLGRSLPIAAGVTPGSGPAHLALWGYEPYEIEFGRGVLEALGSDFDMQPGDLAARANFATVDSNNIVHDRRAERPPDEENVRLCQKLRDGLEGKFPDVELILLNGKEHRFTVLFRGGELGANLNDNDPQREGLELLPIVAGDSGSERSAGLVETFLNAAREILADEEVATGMLLRGFSGLPDIVPFNELYGADSAAIAAYPMYRGVARLVGMKVLGSPHGIEEEVQLLEEKFAEHDFFFLHYKPTDSAGHSGLFDEKVSALEAFDAILPRIEALEPDAIIVTGDHSTPCIHMEHSWHPVPTIISSKLALNRADAVFTERHCLGGDLGNFKASEMVTLAMAHASRMKKFGA
jgi:2,3-bisphosphoglycerate-independent phosphoglycerate mutase